MLGACSDGALSGDVPCSWGYPEEPELPVPCGSGDSRRFVDRSRHFILFFSGETELCVI